jgi:hypothetical protein
MTPDLDTALDLARRLVQLRNYKPVKRRWKRTNRSKRARIVRQIRKAFAGRHHA